MTLPTSTADDERSEPTIYIVLAGWTWQPGKRLDLLRTKKWGGLRQFPAVGNAATFSA